MELSDHELLGRIAAGDNAAFAAFYDRHAPRVLGSLLRLLNQRADAEDVLQETFWQVWCRARQYDPARSTPGAWLYLIARSRGLDRLRQRRPEAEAGVPAEPAASQDPQRVVEHAETAQRLRQALAELPEEQRSAITLAFYGGLTYEQVAHRQAVPVGTAKTRIRLAMRRLRHLLAE